MTTAANFNTNALYPGGEGKCKVGTSDLYPSDPWKVRVRMEDLHKWMWNLEEWDVDFSAGLTTPTTASVSIGGKNHYADVSVDNFTTSSVADWGGEGRILDVPPNARVCGKYYQTSDGSGISPTNATGSEERLLPSAHGGASWVFGGSDPDPVAASGSFNISDGVGNVGTVDYNCSISQGLGFYGNFTAGISFYYIRLLGDGTADVYFNASMSGDEYGIDYFSLTKTSQANAYTSSTSVNMTIFGVTVGGFINWQDGTMTALPPAATGFSFTFALTVTTAFTY